MEHDRESVSKDVPCASACPNTVSCPTAACIINETPAARRGRRERPAPVREFSNLMKILYVLAPSEPFRKRRCTKEKVNNDTFARTMRTYTANGQWSSEPKR
ncbi:hypothetical protein EVAR_69740_1 [Eumeta japonica]|uniref:Uncharacterized protein n=1 Tax=Eumeta variegata TaxID=151549 RepID=A0A4C2A539_EUMVA|nr:hypothetical protein EVAR_69740_1 [Eumeta japonica]